MLIILCGSIGRSVTGGQAWANLQYLVGLCELGHDVYYLEDCGDWSEVYNWESGRKTTGLDYPSSYIQQSLDSVGLHDRWIYRVGDQSEGLTIGELQDLCNSADLLLIRGLPILCWRSEYSRPRRRAFIDVDPGFTQISLQTGDAAFSETIGHSEHLFTYGQRIGLSDCPIPTSGRTWKNTVPPIVLSQWPAVQAQASGAFTSLLRWRGVKDLEYNGVTYGQKDREFPKFINLPQQTSQRLKLALTGGGMKQCMEHGWEVVPGWEASKTTDVYQRFIQSSKAEFGVAKHCYVHGRVGWFSDRSVCYLASGRPVLVQDTQLGDWLPTGQGVVTFQDLPEAVEGVRMINEDYERHAQAARRLAEHYFAADRVLTSLLAEATE